MSGKKHLKNLENLEKSKNGTYDPYSIDTPAATNLIIGPVENPAANDSSGVNVQKSEKRAAQSEAPKEDLETKKKKVIEGGAAAVRVCTGMQWSEGLQISSYRTEACCHGKEASSHSSNDYCCIKT